MLWRIHAGLAGTQLPAIKEWVAAQGDVLQVVDGPLRGLEPPPLLEDGVPGLALTTLNDASRLDWNAIPGRYWDAKMYQVSFYLPRLESAIPALNRGGVFLPVGCLHHLAHLGLFEQGAFIRPDSGQKPFPGQALEAEQLKQASSDLMTRYKLAPDLLCYCAPSRAVEPLEWRFWIVNREVVAWSPYAWESEEPWADAPSDVLEVARQMAANPWQPDIAYVADVAIAERNPYLLELNAASTSGLYQVPIDKLFSALRVAAHQELAGELELFAS